MMPLKEETELSDVSIPHCEHQSFVRVLHSLDPTVMTGTCEKGYTFGYNGRE